MEPAADAVATFLPSPTIPGISDSVRVRGDLVLVSGQVGMGADGEVPDEFADEVDAAFGALTLALAQAGASIADVVKLTLFVVDLPSRSLDELRSVRDRWVVADRPPASSLVGVAALFHPDVRFEVEAIAAVPSA